MQITSDKTVASKEATSRYESYASITPQPTVCSKFQQAFPVGVPSHFLIGYYAFSCSQLHHRILCNTLYC